MSVPASLAQPVVTQPIVAQPVVAQPEIDQASCGNGPAGEPQHPDKGMAPHLAPRVPRPEAPVRTDLTPMDLARTHNGSEHKLYSCLYELMALSGLRERQFTHREMSERTGIRSSSSVKEAVKGLIAKQSIELLWTEPGNTGGSMYRVYKPSEVDARRRAANISVDLRTKKVVPG
ncbi:MAG: hypothetical protein ACREDR_07080 [Blastocatellia bacterium]